MQQLASTLKRVELFYNSIGGLLGYHRKCLHIMLERSEQQSSTEAQSASPMQGVTFHMPRGPDLAGPDGRQLAAESAAAGLEALPHMAEIYPLGGMHFASSKRSRLPYSMLHQHYGNYMSGLLCKFGSCRQIQTVPSLICVGLNAAYMLCIHAVHTCSRHAIPA